MSTSITPSVSTLERNGSSVVDRQVAPRPVRWTKEQYHRMGDIGLFLEKRVELIEGEVIEMAAMNPPHFVASGKTADRVRLIFSTGYIICDAKPVALSENSEPEPDITVVRGQWDDFGTGLPAPSAIALAIEISATTLTYDLERKADLYARAGIADYWVLDVDGRRLIVHREPRDGKYQNIQTLNETDSIAPLEKPDASIHIVDLLP